MKKKIFLSACEPSADRHCGNLIKAVKKKSSADDGLRIEFTGIGGPEMQAAGCELLDNTIEKAAMLYNAFAQVGQYYKRIRRIRAYFRENDIDLVIVCDSPAFNFHIAKAAKKEGIKVLFYVAPQLWAWAPWRIRKMRKCCDKLACILPFEQEWFSSRGIDATFVGNPMLDELPFEISGNERDYANFDAKNAEIAILPGSRQAEIDTLWKPMQQIAVRLAEKYPGMKFKVPAVSEEKLKILKQTQFADIDFEYITGNAPGVCRESDFAIIACGSVALQVAAAGCPMVVMYQSSRFVWHTVGRWLINTRFYCLVNILAGREIVPEFMPYFTSIDPIFAKVCNFLDDKRNLAELSNELLTLVKSIAVTDASSSMGGITLEMIE